MRPASVRSQGSVSESSSESSRPGSAPGRASTSKGTRSMAAFPGRMGGTCGTPETPVTHPLHQQLKKMIEEGLTRDEVHGITDFSNQHAEKS